MNILAIDLSMSATGLAMISFDDLELGFEWAKLPGSCRLVWECPEFRYHGALVERTSEDFVGKIDDMLLPILEWAMYANQVIIEGYAFSRNMQFARANTELGGIVRYQLRKIGQTPLEISPSSLKKFLAGHGFAKKDQMLEAVQRLGVPITDDNMADAFGLAYLGYALQLPDSAYLEYDKEKRETIRAIKYPVRKDKRKKKSAPDPEAILRANAANRTRAGKVKLLW